MSYEVVRLGDVTKKVRGISYKGSDISEIESDIYLPVLRANNIQDSRLNYENLVFIDKSRIKEEQLLRKGDIVIAASSGSIKIVGKAGQVLEDKNASFGAFCKLIRPLERLNPNYLNNFFKTSYYKTTIEKVAQGANINNLRNEDLDNLQIPLPPLDIQKKIADTLDKAQELIDKRKEQISVLDKFLENLFLDMFGDPVSNPMGWEKERIDNIGIVQGGLQVSEKRNTNPMMVPYLRVANVYRNELKLDEIKFMNITPNELERTRLQKNDILIVEGHGNKNEIGRCAIWDDSIDNCVHQNHLIRVRVDSNTINSTFLSSFINSNSGRSQMFKSSNTTSGLNTISTTTVKEISIILPSIDLQNQFASIVEKVEAEKTKLKASLVDMEDNFNSIMQRAFKGELF